MRKNLSILIFFIFLTNGCDNYKFRGMDGNETLNAANQMALPDAYNYYIETYTQTNPPMVDVAKTFERFGPHGTDFLIRRSLISSDKKEFEANMTALLILDYKCTIIEKQRLARSAAKIDVQQIGYVEKACGD